MPDHLTADWETRPTRDPLFKAALEVCPNSDSNPAATPTTIPTPSAWAAETLQFTPQGKQLDVLDSPAHRLILCCTRQWGKSTVIALKALHTALFTPKSRILVLSRSLAQAGEIIEKSRDFAAQLDIPLRKLLKKSFSVLLPNKSRIFALPHSALTSRGYTADIIVVDEAAMVDDAVLSAVLPSASRTNGKLWLLSTPNGQTGVFYDVWHSKDPAWLRILSPVEECPQISPDFIEEQRRLFPHKFRQEFYCEFTPPAGRLLDRARIDRILDPALDSRPRL